MKLAFSITVHKSPDQVVRLASAICRNGNYCIIHCNKLSGVAFRDFIKRGLDDAGITTVRFLESEPVVWGGPSVLRVHMRAMTALLDWAEDWSHYINLTGQCLPTKPLDDIEKMLFGNKGVNFLEMIDIENTRPELADRYTKYHIEIGGNSRNTHIPRAVPRNLKLYFGAFWCVLARDGCLHIARSPEAARVMRYLRFTKYPDELCFQTILFNSHLRETIVPETRRLMLWEGGSPHPLVLTNSHWDEITAPNILFARKFDPEQEGEIVERIGRTIGADLSVARSSHV